MSAPVATGDVVLEKYRVERVLGQGGMGVVVAATHVDLDQRVALKFLLPEALAHPELVERFAREARAAAKIQSQHVARVIDTGKMPNGAPFMVMEYLEGRDLGEVLEQSGPLSPALAVDYVLQACEAIGEAHAAGIVHRDLKPANLYLAQQRDRRAIVKVLDFGISKVEDPKSAPLTRTATMMGSPLYMSPEQLTSSKDVDARTDIWALGVILYELVSGRRPFDAETMPEVVALILRNQPMSLLSVCPDVPEELGQIVARCLSTSPNQRFRTVADLATALRPFAGDAAAADASVSRISRVLGGASLPPSRTQSLGSGGAPPSSSGIAVGPASGTFRDSSPQFSVDATVALPGQVQTAPAVAITQDPVVTQVSAPPSRRVLPLVAVGAVVVGMSGYLVVRALSGPQEPTARGAALVATNVASASPSVTAGSTPSATAAQAASATPAAEPSADTAASSAPAPSAALAAPVKAQPPLRTVATAKTPPAPAPAPSSKSPLNMGIK